MPWAVTFILGVDDSIRLMAPEISRDAPVSFSPHFALRMMKKCPVSQPVLKTFVQRKKCPFNQVENGLGVLRAPGRSASRP